MPRRVPKCLLVLSVGVLLLAGTAGGAAARPAPDQPGGVTAAEQARLQASGSGDCATATCKPTVPGRASCTGDVNQTVAPKVILVYVPSSSAPNHIVTVPFETYVENVLPNEWADSWDGDALKAGAVAITSYAWYWVTHFGGYVDGDPTKCFDVTDDQNFQVYKPGSALPNSTSKVQQVFPSAIRRGGSVIQASYVSALNTNSKPVPDKCGEDANGTQLSQTGSQACNEANTAYKWPIILQRYYGSGIQLASPAQLRMQHDFQYLHRSTRVTFASGTWTIDDGYPTTIAFGTAGDQPVVNTAGDGFARIGVFRPSTSTFYFGSPTGSIARKIPFGTKGDVAVAAQYNGDTAPTQPAVFRPSTGAWYFASPTGSIASKVLYGAKGDVPVPGNWTTTAADSIAVFRPSTAHWYIRGTAGSVAFGTKGDIPVPADYDGNGRTEIAVYRPSTHTFYIRGRAGVSFGATGDIPVTGDFTGDGKADIAVYRPSTHTWYVQGLSSLRATRAGTPIGRAPYRD